MASYTKTVDFLAKDSLLTGNPAKKVKGSEIDTEFNNIATADADNVKASALGSGVATWLATPSSANLAAAVTGETGSGALVFATSPTLVTPLLGTPTSGTLTNCTGLPAAGVVGTSLVSADLGVSVQAYDADTLKSDVTKTLTVGYSTTPYNAGTKSSGTYTPDEANGAFQYCVNGGAFTLAPPTNNCTLIIQITNNASAGTVTTSGFTKVTGSAPGTTNGDDFLGYITKINGFSHLAWQALQ